MNDYPLLGTRNMYDSITEDGRKRKGVVFSDGFSLITNTIYVPVKDWTRPYLPYHTAETRIIVVKEGPCKLNINMHETTLRDGDILLVRPGVLCEFYSQYNQYNASIIALAASILDSYDMPDGFCVLHPDNDGQRLINKVMDIVYETAASDRVNSEVMTHFSLVLLNLLTSSDTISGQMPTVARRDEKTKHRAIFNNFLRLLCSKGIKHHHIPFYAEQLGLTPNYLNYIITKLTGKTMNDWITAFLVAKAKAALAHTSNSIVEISDALGFPNQAFFTRFFRNNTGATPTDFRKKNAM